MKLVSQYFQSMFTEPEQKPQPAMIAPMVPFSGTVRTVTVRISVFTEAHPLLTFSEYKLHYWCSFDQQAIPVSGIGDNIRCLLSLKANK